MNKREFFLAAMKADEARREESVIALFCLTREGPDDWKQNPYPYRVVQTPTGFFYVDPNNTTQLLKIEDAKPNEAMFNVRDVLEITKADGIANYTQSDAKLTTTYGELLANYICLIYPFGNKIPYINSKFNPKKIEDLIVVRLKDNPKDESERNENDIYVDEYLKFCDAMFYIGSLSVICVPAASAKTITAPPGIVEYRNKLLEENKDRLSDPAVIARIDKALTEYDKEYMKGDVGEGFLIKDKQFAIVRKKLFGMHGAEVGLEDKVELELIKNSLSEGWDVDAFPAMNNSLRAGSYDRGAQTMLGGEAFKWLQRASSNITVSADDCGTKLGMLINIDESNLHAIVGFNLLIDNQNVLVPDMEAAKKYIGKEVMVRSPMFCQMDKTDFCKACVGENLANTPTGLSVAITGFGSTMLAISLAGAHAKQLALAKLDYKKSIM